MGSEGNGRLGDAKTTASERSATSNEQREGDWRVDTTIRVGWPGYDRGN